MSPLRSPNPEACKSLKLQVEDVLDAREWDQYKDMIDELRGLIAEPDARAPGSRAFQRILQLHTAISKVAKIKASPPGQCCCCCC